MKHRIAVAVALVLAGPSAPWVLAQIPASGESRINTFTTSHQDRPAVTAGSEGGARGGLAELRPGRKRLRRLRPALRRAGQPRASSSGSTPTRPAAQSSPSSPQTPRATSSSAWHSYAQDGSGYGVFAPALRCCGRSPRRRVPGQRLHESSEQWHPVAASDAAGNFVVAWTSYGQDGSDSGVLAPALRCCGQRPRRRVPGQHRTRPTSRPSPRVAVGRRRQLRRGVDELRPGRELLTASSRQRYDAAGQPRGGEFQVNTFTTDEQ